MISFESLVKLFFASLSTLPCATLVGQTVSAIPNPAVSGQPVSFYLSLPQGCQENRWYFYFNGQQVPNELTPVQVGTFPLTARGTPTPPCPNANANTIEVQVTPAAQSNLGFVNPKYIVVGISYAPPGTISNVSYSGTTTVGNTLTIQNSFASGTTFSVTTSKSASPIPAGVISNGTYTVSNTNSTGYTQSQNSGTNTSLSKSSTLTYQASGFPPNLTSPVVPSDYDTVYLWLNPLVVATYQPPAGSAPGQVSWSGYAYDPTDPSGTGGPDIYPVQIGYLNGHFADSPSIDQVLSRSWTSSEDLQWPAGEGPGLTAADKATIVSMDVLADPNYTYFSGLPQNTADDRFTQEPYGPNPIPYVPGGLNTKYTTVQMNTQSQSQGNSSTFQQAFGISTTVTGNFFNFFTGSTTLTKTQTFSWTSSSLDTLTSSTSLTDALSITGPPSTPPYSGPSQYIAYQDNVFGTFLFYPSN